MTYYNVEVCEDCYIALEYGHRPVEPGEDYSTASGARTGSLPSDIAPLPLWWVGERDTVTATEPLHRLPDRCHLSDNTCPEHDGTDDLPCQWCEASGDEDGYIEFTWRSCEGCGSSLGGARYRLAVHEH